MAHHSFSVAFVAVTAACWLSLAQAANTVPDLPESEQYFRAPTQTPVWLKGHENLLPPVDEDIVNEMANLLNYWAMVASEGGPRPEYAVDALKALKRAAELKQQAAHAVLVLYTYEDTENPRSDTLRGRLAELIERDPTILNYTLPFFRHRLAYITEQFRAKNMQAAPGETEFGVLLEYLLTWGDEKDKAALREMLQLLETNGKDDYYLRGKAETLLKAFTRETEGATAGYTKSIILRLQITTSNYIAHGLSQEHALKSPATQTNSGAPGSVKQDNSPVQTKAPNAIREFGEARASRDWLVWLVVVIVATGGAVWLFLRKSKP